MDMTLYALLKKIIRDSAVTVDDTVSDVSINPVQNKVIKDYIDSEGELLESNINTINSKIPTQASSDNQLADKDFVNSSISTATATFRGTFTNLAELQATDGDKNDYAFYSHTDSAGNRIFGRYKYVGIPETRVPEGYTELYSIGRSRNSTGYINTGVTIKSNYSIYAKINFTGNNYYISPIFFGAKDSQDKRIFLYRDRDKSDFPLICNSIYHRNLTSYANGERIFEIKNNKYYIDNSFIASINIPDIEDGTPCYLFGMNSNGVIQTTSGTNDGTTFSICAFKVWDNNDNLILDLVPCKNQENRAGMYDVVSNQFFSSPNNILFTETPLSTDKWAYEYSLNNSSFTSEQWAAVNSGLTDKITNVGYKSNATQVLKNVNGTLQWTDSESDGTVAAVKSVYENFYIGDDNNGNT